MRSVDAQLLEAELMISTPEHVHAWLKGRAEAPLGPSSGGDEELEEVLLRRNSPLIDIGLAQYGFSAKVIMRLFAGIRRPGAQEILVFGSPEQAYLNTPKRLRLAALSNRMLGKACFPYVLFGGRELSPNVDGIREFLASADADEVTALFQNPTTDGDFFASLYAKEPPFDGFDDQKWQQFIVASVGNPRLREEYTGPMDDGWLAYDHGRVFDEAWRLAERVPPTEDWAKVLILLLEQTRPEGFIKDKMSAIERWRADTTPPVGSGNATGCSSEAVKYRFAECGYLDDFAYMRRLLARLMPVGEVNLLRTSEDVALRCAFYQFGEPTPTEMKEAYEREPEFFLNNALENDALWRKRETRSLLEDLCWADESTPELPYRDYYRQRQARVSVEHPGWFQRRDEVSNEHDNSHNDLAEGVKALLLRQAELRDRIVSLHARTNVILWMVAILLLVLLLRRWS